MAPTLTDLGLSNYESRVYRTLLKTGPTTANELSTASNVPMGRIYDILNRLDTTGLIRTQNTTRPKKYAAHKPQIALDRLLDLKRTELEAEIEEYETTIAELTDRLTATDPVDEPFWTVAVGPTETIDLLVDRLATATSRIIMVAATPSSQFDLGDVGNRIASELTTALHRDVALSILISPSLLEAVPDDVHDRYQDLIRSHEAFDVRLDDNITGSFTLIDRTEVCIDVPNPLATDESFAVIALTDPEFAANVHDEFRPRWNDATPYPTP